MPQLDFREALSTPEEKVYSGPASAPSLRVLETNSFLRRDVGLSHSTWANIVFVAIATVGALVSAFYFFNGAETLRAAAAWPGEFLYPRPASTDRIDVAMQPISVDRYDRDSNRSATKNEGAEDSSTPDFRNPQLAQATPFTESQDSTPVAPPSDGTSLPSVPPSALPVTPVTPVLPVPPLQPVVPPPTDSIFHELNSLQPATRTFVESTLQTITETFTDVLPKNAPAMVARAKVNPTRKKIANTRTKSTARNSDSSTAKSGSQTTQKIATQIQAPIIQNQTMFGGGMGVTSGLSGGIGSAGGVGGTSVSAGGVGTTGGVSGIGSGGIGGVGGVGGIGGIGGVGGLPGVGGVVGGLPGGIPGHH